MLQRRFPESVLVITHQQLNFASIVSAHFDSTKAVRYISTRGFWPVAFYYSRYAKPVGRLKGKMGIMPQCMVGQLGFTDKIRYNHKPTNTLRAIQLGKSFVPYSRCLAKIQAHSRIKWKQRYWTLLCTVPLPNTNHTRKSPPARRKTSARIQKYIPFERFLNPFL